MSELKLDAYIMPSASLGKENPLPALDKCLPYTLQDDYDRTKKNHTFKTVVLENETLKATFLIEFGGRLWSLYHKKRKRELLYVNPVFQPCNIAIRNAWFSGGVEWNIGITGHSVFTCSPVFAAVLKMDDGTPVFRIYEWERIRMVPFQIDFFLPDYSEFLFVRVKIVNPNEFEVPMYWWSNIAVPEEETSRVIVPAVSCYRYTYKEEKEIFPVPVINGIDLSYPANFKNASDMFYLIEPGRQPWITIIDREGAGLIQTSSLFLKGRKLFVWGMSQGGRNWQEFLSIKGSPYIEIQAGITHTQSEYIQMPAGAEWSWLEAYGLIEISPEKAHSKDWEIAYNTVDSELKKMLPLDKLDEKLSETRTISYRRPDEIIQYGSGWGALERIRREHKGLKPLPASFAFDDGSLEKEQMQWLKLLKEGELPYAPPVEKIYGWMTQKEWCEILEKSVREGKSDHWLSWLHLGVMYYSQGNFDKARTSWEKSISKEPSLWAYRNLAVLAQKEGDMKNAEGLMKEAWKLSIATEDGLIIRSISTEYCKLLIDAGKGVKALEFINGLPEEISKTGRIKLLEAHAALQADELQKVESFFKDAPVIPDIREGENFLTELWFEMHTRRIAKEKNIPVDDKLRKRVRGTFPPPSWADFRQST
ncbi:MAG TPA: DUF5107 domain-containing protein [bacterium]|nr:DUF5107 domain-containing protein [bacterium]HPP29793.1 DUF5107 domain-containing protein [bacterium]